MIHFVDLAQWLFNGQFFIPICYLAHLQVYKIFGVNIESQVLRMFDFKPSLCVRVQTESTTQPSTLLPIRHKFAVSPTNGDIIAETSPS